jgi:hypothetical protein
MVTPGFLNFDNAEDTYRQHRSQSHPNPGERRFFGFWQLVSPVRGRDVYPVLGEYRN